MELKYPHISSGYLGIKTSKATLNSAFFAEILDHSYDFNNRITFVQRVPRIDFFTELSQLETKKFQNIFLHKLGHIKSHNFYRQNFSKIDNSSYILNWLNVLIRLGQSKFILNLEPHQSFSIEDCLEFQLIQEQAKIELSLSNNVPISLVSLLTLTEKMRYMDIDPYIKLYALSRIIVNVMRHKAEINNPQLIINYTNDILELLRYYEKDSFRANILKSIIYRGIAMVDYFGVELQNKWLELSEFYARNIKPLNIVETIVAKDNLCTCLQTLSKWNMHKKQFIKAENNLCEITFINSLDSTAYSELGLFLMKLDRHEDASMNFKKASELGPPGVGMNTYFYAKYLQKVGKPAEAIKMFYECIAYDPVAISPWLEIFEYHVHQNNNYELNNVAKHILFNTQLVEQLEIDELKKIRSYYK